MSFGYDRGRVATIYGPDKDPRVQILGGGDKIILAIRVGDTTIADAELSSDMAHELMEILGRAING